MKYLKLFENYPSPRGFTPNSIEEDVNDMFIELKDDGYKIEYQRFNERGDSVSLTIKYGRGFNSNDVREYVMMFIDYMTDKFGEQRVFYRGRTPAYETDDTFYANGKVVTTDDFPDDTELTALNIGVNARYKDKNQTKLQLESYIALYEDLFHEGPQHLQDNINAALVELEDLGFQVDKIFSLDDDKEVSQEYKLRVQKDLPYKYIEIKEIVSTFIEYIEEIWGYVNVKWRCYGYPDPIWSPKSFSTEPENDTPLYDVELTLKNHN